MSASFNNVPQSPVILSSGATAQPFAVEDITSPYYTTGPDAYLGGDFSIHLQGPTGLLNTAALTGTIADPGVPGITGSTLLFDPSTNTYSGKSSYGIGKTSYLTINGILDRIVYTAPQVANGQDVAVTATVRYLSATDTAGQYQWITDPTPEQIQVNAQPITSAVPTVGDGPDTFAFRMSEDAYAGDAQFVVRIDGVQQSVPLAVTTLHSSGQSQDFVFKGTFGNQRHVATVEFINDTWGGTGIGLDRNLFVDAISFNGLTLNPGNGALWSNGSMDFIKPGSVTDTLAVSLSEDAYQGDAYADIYMDSKMLAGSIMVTAHHSGMPNTLNFTGDFGPGTHTVGVNFLNDTWGGSGMDRNMYVDGISFNGVAQPNTTGALWSEGSLNFTINV